jgi:hypothetical protein
MRQHDAPPVFTLAPVRPPTADVDLATGMNITVVFTTLEGTRTAATEADRLAADLGARVTVVVPDVIPYHLPLDRPYLAEGFLREQLESMLAACRTETRVEILLCRDPELLLRRWLRPGSLVLLGATRRRWHWKESRLCRMLTRLGHDAVVVVPGRHRAASATGDRMTSLSSPPPPASVNRREREGRAPAPMRRLPES